MNLAPVAKKRKAAKSAKKRATDVVHVPIGSLSPCPENETLYKPVDPNDADVVALAESIRKNGVREPLVVTLDHYILSGHRRYVAATLAGLRTVPCRYERVRYSKCDGNRIAAILREYNRQRVKSLDELLREEVVSADPNVAYDWLLNLRRQKSDMSDCDDVSTIEMSEPRARKTISQHKVEMLNAVMTAIESYKVFWPLSDRQIHYILCGNPPLRHTKKRKSKYMNDRASYHDLCDLLTRARLTGVIPWQAIADETRSLTQWACYSNAQDFIREQLDALFGNYMRDLQRSQPTHVEILCEKLTLKGILEPIAAKYCLPLLIGRGYCSVTPRHDIAQRFRKSGKATLTLLILSDFDPDGESIAESFARSMRDDFDIENIQPIKVALTENQVEELKLIPEMQAKKSSRQYAKFSSRFGDNVYELEAVAPESLQRLLSDAIEAVFDMQLWNQEVDAERADATFLANAKQRACRALSDMK